MHILFMASLMVLIVVSIAMVIVLRHKSSSRQVENTMTKVRYRLFPFKVIYFKDMPDYCSTTLGKEVTNSQG